MQLAFTLCTCVSLCNVTVACSLMLLVVRERGNGVGEVLYVGVACPEAMRSSSSLCRAELEEDVVMMLASSLLYSYERPPSSVQAHLLASSPLSSMLKHS